MKKLIIIILFLLPITFLSFNKAKSITIKQEKPIIVYVTDKNLSLDLNDYIIGVVASEMPALFESEALKAQAIASRSYALSSIYNNTITIGSSINDQVYQTNYELKNKWQDKYNDYYTKIKDAVTATQNLVIKRDNKILKTYYFSMSNGQTENSLDVFNISVFESVSSPYEESLPNFKINKTYSTSELKTLFNLNTITIGEIKRNKTNHVTSVIINNEEYTGIQIRKLLNLRSTDFTIVQNGSDYIFTTKGYGHGVGMSQYGANEMAKLGKNYIDILKHYYKNTKITKI